MLVRVRAVVPKLLCVIVLTAPVAVPVLRAQNTDNSLPPVIDVHVHSMTESGVDPKIETGE